MPKIEHHPWDEKPVTGGVNQMFTEELHGNVDSGDVYDSFNMTPNKQGKIGSRVKIEGETRISFIENEDADRYVCFGAVDVRGKKIEVWGGINDGAIVIDGVLVCQSEDLPIRSGDMGEVIGNDNVIGGEIYVNNRRTAPFILSVKDLEDNIGDDTYFADFNIDRYAVNLKAPLNILAFKELVFVGGGAGVPIGAYTYSVRYATASGDRTNWSVETPVIIVPENLSVASKYYRSAKTIAGPANVALLSGYGVKLRFRVCNEYNFDFIEIKRTPFNLGAGTLFTPNQEIIAKVDVAYDQISVIEFIDGKDNNVQIPIANDDLANQFTEIEKANSIVYADRRLHLLGVTYASRDISDVALKTSSISGNVIDPFVMKIGKDGHNDSYNAAYFKSYTRGEKVSFALVGFDGLSGAGLAKKYTQLNNYSLPNRRTAASNVTEFWCNTNGRGMVQTSALDNLTRYTHEVFDIVDGEAKPHPDDFTVDTSINILTRGSGGAVDPQDIGYKPLTPTKVKDSRTWGHAYPINPDVYDGSFDKKYAPAGFSPDYYSLGVMLAGVNKDTIPAWMKSFTIVRSKMAGRVVVQGIGMYCLDDTGAKDGGNIKKENKKFWFYSSDINNGVISQQVVEDIRTNPSRYKIQIVAPFGFFSEVYMGDSDADFVGLTNKDADIDMVSYVRAMKKSINPGDTGEVKFGMWRNVLSASNDVVASDDKIFDITGFETVSEGRGEYFELSTTAQIYDKGYCSSKQFNSNEVKEWHEPFYIVNIIQEGAEVPDSSIMTYEPTGHYQKIESLLALSSGISGFNVDLVDERFEDCCPDAFSTTRATDNVYIFIRDTAGNDKRWLNVTYKDDATRNTILSDIQAFGFYNDGTYDIYGVYTHEVEQDRFYKIVFSNFNTYFSDALFVPAEGMRIVVKYDDRFPIKVFGGDCFISESVFSPIDRDTTNGENEGMLVQVGMPYYKWYWNDNYTIPKNVSPALITDNVQNATSIEIDYIRQWIVMFTAETKSANFLNYADCFPNIHYIMRPLKWKEEDLDSNFAIRDNGASGFLDGIVRKEYLDDYPGEADRWGYGGFRFEEKVNSDHSSSPYRRYFSKPDFEFVENTEFGTRDHYSNQRAVNQQFYPGLRSFPPFNTFDADDSQGAFNKGFYGESLDKGNNLYVLSERGAAILFIGKKTLADANGNTIGYMAADGAITGEYWMSRSIGCPGDFFKSFASNGNDFFFASQDSFYKMSNNQIIDIAGGYKPYLVGKISAFNSSYTNTYLINAAYDRNNKEYWVTLEAQDLLDDVKLQETSVMVFCENPESTANNKWIGRYGYQFDEFLYSGRKMYGFREFEAYELLNGSSMNNSAIEGYIDVVFSKEIKYEKEFIRFSEGSRQKPDTVEFYVDGVKQCSVTSANIKDYGFFEQDIPRKDAAVDPNRARLQHDYMIKRIIKAQGDFEITSSRTQYKILK